VNKEYEGTFPNIEMNTVPHLQLVQHIEAAIKESEPDIIITHHPAEAIEGFAAYRGCQAGCNYAEAFEVVLRRQ